MAQNFLSDIKLGDNIYIRLGDATNGDLQIFHNASNSIIRNDTGDLRFIQYVDDGKIRFYNDNGSGGITEYFRIDGSAEETLFSKQIRVPDNVHIAVGGSSDLKIYHGGTHSFIDNQTGNLYIRNYSDDKNIHFQTDDGSGGIADYMVIHGQENIVKFQENTRHLDNKEARFGTGSDLKIYHESSTGHSHIKEAGTGELRLSANIFRVLNANSSETMIYAEQDGKVQLRFNEQTKFETTTSGINVTGTVTLDNLASIQGVDTGNPQANTDELRVSGYGIMGRRGTVYVTNSDPSGSVQIGVSGSHNSNPKLIVNATDSTFYNTLNVGTFTSTGTTTLNLRAESENSTKLGFFEDSANYGFSLNYAGDVNDFIIKRHDNSASGADVITLFRESNQAKFAGNLGISGAAADSNKALRIKSQSVSAQSSAIEVMDNSDTNAIIRMGEKSTDGGRLHMFDAGVEKIAFYTDGTANHISAGELTINNAVNNNNLGIHIKNDNNLYSGALTFWTEYSGTDTHAARVQAGTDGTDAALYLQVANTSKALTSVLTLDHDLKSTFAGNLYLPEYIYHDGNTTTYARFQTNRLTLHSGGGAVVDLHSNGQLYFTGVSTFYNNVTFAGEVFTEQYFETDSGQLLSLNEDSWNSGNQQHYVLYNGWRSGTGDYLLVKSSGNQNGGNGAIIISDGNSGRVYFGKHANAAAAVDSATAPLDTTYAYIGGSANYFSADTTFAGSSVTLTGIDIGGHTSPTLYIGQLTNAFQAGMQSSTHLTSKTTNSAGNFYWYRQTGLKMYYTDALYVNKVVDIDSTSYYLDPGNTGTSLNVAGAANAGSFVKSGGTSSQYLMADGSVSTTSFSGGTVANATTFSSNVTVNGKLRIAVAWDSGTLENNAIYAKNSTDGFGFGNGTGISTWWAWSTENGLMRMIDSANSGAYITLRTNNTDRVSITNSGLDVKNNGDIDVGNLRIVGDNDSADQGKAFIRSNGDYLVLNAADGEHVYLNWDSANGMSGHVYVNTNIYAQAFYDRNDTTYYLDPASTSTSLNAAGSATFAGDVQAQGIYVGSSNTSFDFYNNGTSYFNGNVEVNAKLHISDEHLVLRSSSPEFYLATTGNHYNWMIAAQENVDGGLEFGHSAATATSLDLDASNYVRTLTLNSDNSATFAGTITTDRLSLFTSNTDRATIQAGSSGTTGHLYLNSYTGTTLKQLTWSAANSGFYPQGASGSFSLGLTGNRWSNVYTAALNASGNATITGDTFTDGLYVNATSAVSGTQVAIVKDGDQNLQRWGSSTSGAHSYRFRIDQNFKFIGNNGGADKITIESNTGNIDTDGDITIGGNLYVTGTSTTVNVEDLNVEQGEITLNYNASSDTSGTANGAGIRIQDGVNATTDVTMLWDKTSGYIDFSNSVEAPGFKSLASNSFREGMSIFETSVTNADDWTNSPISIRERDTVGSTQSADKYSPNLNFHWGSRVSRSLWMDADGHLHYGEYSSTGIPDDQSGHFRANEIHANIFRDKGSTGFYLDPASTGTSLNIAGAIELDDAKPIKWGTENILSHNGTQTYVGDSTTSSALTVTGGNLTVEKGTVNGVTQYTKSYASLDTTGQAVAGLVSSSNGASAMFIFETGGGNGSGGYQKVVYNCLNVSGTWSVHKDIDEGGNRFDVTGSGGSTVTFTFKARSSTQSYSPKVIVRAVGGSAINTTYI